MVQALGRQILVEYYGCNHQFLNDVAKVEDTLRRAAQKANATIIRSTFHHFSPFGVSGVVVIAESHISIHTWPEYGYAAVDIFTCGETIEPWDAFKVIEQELGATNTSSIEMKRGIFDMPEGQKLCHKPENAAA
jgi:S-adenosylmethionine decarboxylase